MVKKLREWPDEGEYVIATITALNPNSAFANLDEYGKNCMIHISEVASTWIKDIRKYLKVGQKVVAVVRFVDKPRNVVNLSIKRVSINAKKQKLAESENEKKAENLLGIIAKSIGKNPEDVYKEVGFKLQEKFGLMYAGFEAAFSEGAQALIKAGIDEKWAKEIEDLAKKTIKPKEVFIKALLEIKCFSSDGIETIKKALDVKDKVIEIKYISAPRYSIIIKGSDYPSCEKLIESTSKKITEAVKQAGGEAQLIRE